MDSKRFMELFPELKEDVEYKEKQMILKDMEKEENEKIKQDRKQEEEGKRKEFFDHIKMQLQPERSWELSEAWKQTIWKKKKGKRKLLMYSATAAACLILVIVLPNLSELLKMSGQKGISKQEEVAFVLEDHSDKNKEEAILDDGNKEKEVLDEEKDKDSHAQKEIMKETKQDPVENNLKDKIKEKEKTVDNQGIEDNFNNHSTVNTEKGIEKTVQEKGKQEKKNKDKKQSNGKVESKKKDQKDVQKNDTKSKDIDKGSDNEEQDQKAEIQTKSTEHDSVDSDGIDDRDVNTTSPENVISDEIDDKDTEIATEATTETTTGSNNTAIDNIGVDIAVDDTIEEATGTVNEITVDTENDFVSQDNVTPDSVEASIESDDEITDADFQNALYDFKEEEQETDIEDQNGSGQSKQITKEAIEKKLKTYPYLYYNQDQKECWYYAEEKLQSSVEGKKLLGTALIFKEKSLVIEEHKNAQQSVFIYGDEKDLSIVFIRFWAEGKDWYYKYKQ